MKEVFRAIVLPAAAIVLHAGVLAQQAVSPTFFSNALGSASPLYPLGLPTGGRIVQVHDDIPGNTTINQISFRPTPLPAGRVARDVTVSVWISNAQTTSTTIVSNFLANHGSNRIQVVNNAVVNFGAMSTEPYVAGPFRDTIPFATPFFYNGVGSLCWEIEVTPVGSQPNVFTYDTFVSPNPLGVVHPSTTFGSGCTNSSGIGGTFSIAMGSNFSGPFSGTYMPSCASGPPLAPGAFFFGYDIIDVGLPNTASGSSGLCTAYTTPVTSVGVVFDSLGTASMSFPVTFTPALHGIVLTAQAAGLDLAANPFGLITSSATTIHWSAPYTSQPASSVFGFPGSTSGVPQVGSGLVIEVQ